MSALHCGYCTFAESLVPVFLRSLLESVRIKCCFGKSLEKNIEVWIQKSVSTLYIDGFDFACGGFLLHLAIS